MKACWPPSGVPAQRSRHRRNGLCGAIGRARRAMRRLPLRMQRLSHALHVRGWRRPARLIAFGNRFVFGAILAPEADLSADVDLLHGGLGLVVHPLVTVGPRCRIQHHVTLGTDTALASRARMVIGADVHIGAHAILLGPIEIGDRARIGAGTVVTTNVAADAAVVGAPTRLLDRRPNDDARGP